MALIEIYRQPTDQCVALVVVTEVITHINDSGITNFESIDCLSKGITQQRISSITCAHKRIRFVDFKTLGSRSAERLRYVSNHDNLRTCHNPRLNQ